MNLTAFDSRLFPICIIRSLSVNTMASCPVFTDKMCIRDRAGATHRRTRETEPSDCGIVERNGSKMVAKISVGDSLYGAIAYNGEKINEAQAVSYTHLHFGKRH